MESDTSSHPWVLYAGVVAAVVAVTLPWVRTLAGSIWRWMSGLKAARIQRRIEIEAAAKMLNDQRVVYLSTQLAGVAAQLDAVLVEQQRERVRADQERHLAEQERHRSEADIADLRAQLGEATDLIGDLRRELAELRAAAAK